MEFTTDTIFEALKTPLGIIDDEERKAQIEAYIEAARDPLERSVFELLSLFAQAVNNEVSAHYQVVLDYQPGVLALDVRRTEPEAGEEMTWTLSEGDVEKITLRLPAELKDLAAHAASQAGLSGNRWFLRVLGRALRESEPPEPPSRPRKGKRGHRLSGWVGPDS